MTRTGDREIGVVSGRLPDKPGELTCMSLQDCSLSRTNFLGNCFIDNVFIFQRYHCSHQHFSVNTVGRPILLL